MWVCLVTDITMVTGVHLLEMLVMSYVTVAMATSITTTT